MVCEQKLSCHLLGAFFISTAVIERLCVGGEGTNWHLSYMCSCEKLSCHCIFVTAFFLGVMKLLNLRGVKSRGVFTKVFSSVFLLHVKAFFAKMALRGK